MSAARLTSEENVIKMMAPSDKLTKRTFCGLQLLLLNELQPARRDWK